MGQIAATKNVNTKPKTPRMSPPTALSSVPPPTGIDDLPDAVLAHVAASLPDADSRSLLSRAFRAARRALSVVPPPAGTVGGAIVSAAPFTRADLFLQTDELTTWAIRNGCPLEDLAVHAARAGLYRTLSRICDTEGLLPVPTPVAAELAARGDVAALCWALRRGCAADPALALASTRAADGATLDWLLRQGMPWNPVAVALAAAAEDNEAAMRVVRLHARHIPHARTAVWGAAGPKARALLSGPP